MKIKMLEDGVARVLTENGSAGLLFWDRILGGPTMGWTATYRGRDLGGYRLMTEAAEACLDARAQANAEDN